jgi:two-component system chemotaxis sensor kinase CheA
MDEEEDFEALFFIECEENLSDLQVRLDALLTGDTDPETVNAAFRAVHSVKGGAAAFGFMDLVGFAHEFETVMDRIRSDALALSPEVCELLLRAGDMMIALVEATRTGTQAPTDRVGRVSAQLAALLGHTAPAAGTGPAPGPAAVAAVASAPEPEEAAESGHDAACEPVVVDLRPGPDFLLAGFDPIRIIRAGRAHGLVSVAVEGTVPPIDAFHPEDCPLAWRLEFEPDDGVGTLERFLATYAYGAEVTLTDGNGPRRIEPDCGEVREQAPALIVDADPARQAAPPDDPAPGGPAPSARPAKAESGPAAAANAPAAAPRSLRVDLDRVDRLVNLVGEVLIAQAAVAQGVADGAEASPTTLSPLVEALSRQTRELQESVMAIRAQPVRVVFGRLPRVVRDLCDSLGKEARLVVEGDEVEVDTTVVEELTEPLVHMIRNAMDHGLETPDERVAAGKPRSGTLVLSAAQRGGRVRITLSDDGRGIDRDRVLAKARAKGLVPPEEMLDAAAIDALIFHPGFSTAESISAVSGRGVGMDVVRRKIQALGGRCVVASVPGQGTTFTISLPLTLAVMDGMAVRVDGQQFILPLANVVEAISVEPSGVSLLPDRSQVVRLRDAFLPVYSLRAALALPDGDASRSTALVIDTETSGHVVVLVDDLLGQRQVVLKSLEHNVGRIDGVGGATILGDGRVALVLDIPALLQLNGRAPSAEIERIH